METAAQRVSRIAIDNKAMPVKSELAALLNSCAAVLRTYITTNIYVNGVEAEMVADICEDLEAVARRVN